MSGPPGIRPYTGRIAIVGRLTPLKGAHYLIRAIPIAERTLGLRLTLDVLGIGPEEARLKALADELGVGAQFYGTVDTQTRDEVMRGADLLAVPSLWPEPFGLVGVEAGCVGLPAVGYAVGGIPEWLNAGQSGELAPGDPPTVEGLAEAIVRALQNPARHALLRAGRVGSGEAVHDGRAYASSRSAVVGSRGEPGMRFLDVADFERDPNSGSAGSLLAIGSALTDLGHHVDHLWKRPEPYRLPHPSLSRWLELPRRQYRQVSDQMKRRQYDVVVVSQPYAYLVFERLPTKYRSTLFLNMTHGWEDRFNAARLKFAWDGPYSPPTRVALGVTKSLVNRACVRTIRACHGFISPSQNSGRYVQRAYAVPEEKIAIIPYGLDGPFLRSDARHIANGEAVRMLYVGNYIVPKGSDVLESILPPLGLAYPQASLTFVVPGNAIERIRSRFEPAFGQRLTTLAWRDRNQLQSIYERHDVLLFPSLFEGFGKTFLEAMACGVCVVGFNEGGLPDIATDGVEALYCETGVVADLRELLERCLRNPGLTRAVGQRAQLAARQYSWPRAASTIQAFCQQRREALGLAVTAQDALVR